MFSLKCQKDDRVCSLTMQHSEGMQVRWAGLKPIFLAHSMERVKQPTSQ
jgi:hypothetical protein